MTGTAALSDRYVLATLRHVPERQRYEIEQELRALIADDAEARVREGSDPLDAERAALSQLGDPHRLAANYANRRLTLIGPDLYPNWTRSLRIVSSTVLPVVALAVMIISVARGRGFWASVLEPIGTTVQVAVYLTFSITVLFALTERARVRTPRTGTRAGAWSVDQLDLDISAPHTTRWGDVMARIVASLVVVALLVVDRFSPVFTDRTGRAVSVLAPALWHVWIPLCFALLLTGIVIEFAQFRLGGRSVGSAFAKSALLTTTAVTLISLTLTTTVINPVLSNASTLAPSSWLWIGTTVLIVISTGLQVRRLWRHAEELH